MRNLIFSIVICTKNRSRNLALLLKSLSKVKFPREQFECIVIDNGSTDDTRKVVQRFKRSLSNLEYYFLNQDGLSLARNLGILKSKGKFVIFLDDDVIADKDLLTSVYKTFLKTTAQVVGGRVKLFFRHKPPFWLTNGLRVYLAELNYGSEHYRIKAPDYLVGANIAFDKSILLKVGGFSDRFGRKDGTLLSSEELELCRRIEKRGGLIFYDHNAIAYHRIDKFRMRKTFFLRRAFWQGISDARLDKLHDRPESLGETPNFGSLFLNILGYFIKPNFERLTIVVRQFGYLVENDRKVAI